MVKNVCLLLFLSSVFWSQLAVAGMQGGAQVKTIRHENFNLAYGTTTPVEESVNTVQLSLTWFKASSKDFVWLLNTYYNYSEYEVNTHLTGSSVSLLGGMFYRVNPHNSMTLKLGKRERKYDDEDLSLYQDDANFITLQLSHRLSSTTLLNEKIKYEENEPNIGSNKYNSSSGQVWFGWNVARSTKLFMGYIKTVREYDETGVEYDFEEPYVSMSYSLTRNMYTQMGYSKLKMINSSGDHAHNTSAYMLIGFGF